MKSILFCLAAFVIAISACQHAKDPNTATIDFSQPIVSDADFIFSTCQGKTFIMADASAAQKMSDHLKAQTGGILSDMGVGNAFVLDMDGKSYLCTATHATVGLEKYTKKIGADIALIDFTAMPQQKFGTEFQLTTAYAVDTAVQTGDSVFVKGYLFNKNGELQSVTVSGKGRMIDENEYNGGTVVNAQYMQQRQLVIKLDENAELGGLSGSPAFNKQGKVIGVYSGRTLDQNSGTYYIRISLF